MSFADPSLFDNSGNTPVTIMPEEGTLDPNSDAAFMAAITAELNKTGDGAEDVLGPLPTDQPETQPPADGGGSSGTNDAAATAGGGETGDGVDEGGFTDPGDPIPGLPPTDTPINGDGQASPGDGTGGAGGSPSSPPDPQTVDLNQLLPGVDEARARALIQLQADLEGLSPLQQAQLQQVLTGQYQQPQPQYQQPQPQYQQPYQQPGPQWQNPAPVSNSPYQQPPSPSPWPQVQMPDEVDPQLAAVLSPIAQMMEAQQQQLQQIQQQQFQAQQLQWQQEQAAIDNAIAQAAEQWKQEKYQNGLLDVNGYLRLENEIRASGMIGRMVAAGADPVATTKQVLDSTYRSHPEYLQAEASYLANQQRTNEAEEHRRRQTSTALSGGGGQQTGAVNGNANNQVQKSVKQMTKEEANDALVAAIENAMNNTQ